MERIVTETKSSTINTVSMLLLMPICLFALYGIYCMFRTVVSVTRGEVFTQKNVRRMRLFIYSLLLAMACIELSQYMNYQMMADQIRLTGYEIASYSTKTHWFTYAILTLFTEIFAAGVKIKEEQDLTI